MEEGVSTHKSSEFSYADFYLLLEPLFLISTEGIPINTAAFVDLFGRMNYHGGVTAYS